MAPCPTVTVQSESVFWNEPLMGYTASVFICPFVNVTHKAQMPGFCVLFIYLFPAVSCPVAEQKAIFP